MGETNLYLIGHISIARCKQRNIITKLILTNTSDITVFGNSKGLIYLTVRYSTFKRSFAENSVCHLELFYTCLKYTTLENIWLHKNIKLRNRNAYI
jgi:hypothetical protein